MEKKSYLVVALAVCLSLLVTSCAPSPTGNANPTGVVTTAASTPTLTSERSTPLPSFATLTPTVTPTVVTPTVLPTGTPTPQPAARAGKVFLAYYVPYDASSWASLEAQADLIDYVAPQWVNVDACGNISSQDDVTLVRFAQSHGIGVLPSLATTSGPLNHRLLTDPSASANAVQQIVDYVVKEGYAGIDLDLEGVNADDRPALTAFVARVSQKIHDQGKLLTMALPVKSYDATTGWAGAYDYAALAPYVDLFTIMAYAYTTSSSTTPGSFAPYNSVSKATSFAVSQIPPSKVLLGLGLFGYDWNLTVGGRARALRYPGAQAIAKAYGVNITTDPTTRSATFSYTVKAGDPAISLPAVPAINHEIKKRVLPTCSYTTPAPPSGPTAVPPTPPPVQQHVVWLEDATAVGARLDIARSYGTGGVAVWRLGQEDPAIWPLIASYRRGTE